MSRYFIVSATFLIVVIVSLALDGMIDISWQWYAGWTVLYISITSVGAVKLSWQYFVPVHYKGNGSSNHIALTFDDGPLPGNTEKILSILEQYQVKAAFFCIGSRVKQNPELVKQAHESGHLIGNHTYRHGKFFDLLPFSSMQNELSETEKTIHEVIGLKPKFFRPPYGVTNPLLAKAIKIKNYYTIGWSVRSFDTITKNADTLLNRLIKKIKGGDIILLHDYCTTTQQILPSLLDNITKSGFKIVRVDELIKLNGYEKQVDRNA